MWHKVGCFYKEKNFGKRGALQWVAEGDPSCILNDFRKQFLEFTFGELQFNFGKTPPPRSLIALLTFSSKSGNEGSFTHYCKQKIDQTSSSSESSSDQESSESDTSAWTGWILSRRWNLSAKTYPFGITNWPFFMYSSTSSGKSRISLTTELTQ